RLVARCVARGPASAPRGVVAMRRAAAPAVWLGVPGSSPSASGQRSRAVGEGGGSLLHPVWVGLARGGVLLGRDHVGVLRQPRGDFARSGLAGGSSDLVGLVPPFGRFIGIEVKRLHGGRIGEHQERWLALVRRFGGVAGVVRSVEEALELVAAA